MSINLACGRYERVHVLHYTGYWAPRTAARYQKCLCGQARLGSARQVACQYAVTVHLQLSGSVTVPAYRSAHAECLAPLCEPA